jgi:hypothetical protein
MRFMEIANPEDQLALWRMVSDSMWKAFDQYAPQSPTPSQPKTINSVRPTVNPSSMVKPLAKGIQRAASIKRAAVKPKKAAKVAKPKKAPMAPPPKPLPKPPVQQPSPTQVKQAQTQQSKQLALHIQQALSKKQPTPMHLASQLGKGENSLAVNPMNNSYNERDRDEIVFHRRQNPLKPLDVNRMR